MTDYKYEFGKKKERLLIKIAFLLPDRIKMWAYIYIVNYATGAYKDSPKEYGKTVVPDITALDALGRFTKDKLGE